MKLDRERLRSLYPHMEEDFSKRMEQLVHSLPQQKEEEPVKRFVLRTALIWVLITVMLCATAYAVINCGLEWYYNNRFSALQETDPEKLDAILANVQTGFAPTVTYDERIVVQAAEASWVPEKELLVVSVAAVANEADVYELHPLWNLDPDGSYYGEGAPEDPGEAGVDRSVHWLWTNEGYGPIEKMIAPGKQLLLLDVQHVRVNGNIYSIGNSIDCFTGEDGAVHAVLEVQNAGRTILEDEDGLIDLTIPFSVTEYTDDDEQLYTGVKRIGEICFQMQIR